MLLAPRAGRAGLGVKAELEHPGSQGAGRGGYAFAQKGEAPGEAMEAGSGEAGRWHLQGRVGGPPRRWSLHVHVSSGQG